MRCPRVGAGGGTMSLEFEPGRPHGVVFARNFARVMREIALHGSDLSRPAHRDRNRQGPLPEGEVAGSTAAPLDVPAVSIRGGVRRDGCSRPRGHGSAQTPDPHLEPRAEDPSRRRITRARCSRVALWRAAQTRGVVVSAGRVLTRGEGVRSAAAIRAGCPRKNARGRRRGGTGGRHGLAARAGR
jgi:hypothetical protein